jgi:hypothetical protein
MHTNGHIVREILSGSKAVEKPDIGYVYAAGSLLGLDNSDIARLHKGSISSRLKTVFLRHRWALLPIAVVIAIVVLVVAYVLAGSPPLNPTSSYPSGTRYNVLKKADFKKSSLIS